MSDFLMREGAPFGEEGWKAVDHVVVHVAQKLLVGRRFIDLTGPLGVGVQTVPIFGVGAAEGAAQVTKRDFLTMQMIQQDFLLSALDIKAAQAQGVGIELGPAAMAAVACAKAEDQMILNGLMSAKGSKHVVLSDWNEPESVLSDVVAAAEALVTENLFGPYAVVLSPALYAKTQRVARGMGRLVSKLIADVAEAGLFQSPFLKAEQGLVVAVGKQNMDLVIGQDLVTAYLGNEEMNHRFRVLESLVLRVKRPGAICTLGK
ncbi:MAG: encapsulin [Anaerolineae bacterium]|nr:encapsulin [Anaerolineae bacterium]